MAQTQQPEGGGEAEFVRRIVSDPRNVPDVMRLYGYHGASSEEGHDRLYLNLDLSIYVEVPQAGILYSMEVPREQDPNGAVVVWVRRDAALAYKAAPAAQALAQYFTGAIAGGAMAAPQPVPWAAPYFAGQTLYPHVCTPQCNTGYPYCGTVTPACTYGPNSVCGCLPPAGAAAMAAEPHFAGQTLYPHVCTPQCNTRYPYCGTVTPACTYGPNSVCGCLPPAGAAAMAAEPHFAGQTLYPHVCTPQCNTRYPYCGTVTPACTYGPNSVCGCLPPAGAAAMAAEPYFAGQTLYPHVCTPQCNTRYPYCGTVTPACTYGPNSVCGCLPPAGAAAMAAEPYFAGQTLYPHVCTPRCNTR